MWELIDPTIDLPTALNAVQKITPVQYGPALAVIQGGKA
jgi:hypothetical protein